MPCEVESAWHAWGTHASRRGMGERADGFESGFFSAARLTLGDVITAGRWAYRPEAAGDFRTFFYDGINFWWQRRPRERTMVPKTVVPTDGWRHRRTCNCQFCLDSADVLSE